MTFAEILDSIWTWLITEGVKVVLGLIVLFVLFKVVNVLCAKIEKKMLAKGVDETITKSGVVIVRRILKILLVLCYITILGVETSSISAAIASVGLAIGLALQGSLSNIAGGVVILVTRPFKIGDYIECGDESGTVEKIEFFYTYILTDNNQVVMIPNSQVANNEIINYSAKENRRLDLEFRIGYEDDSELAKMLILQCVKDSKLALDNPAPFINITRYDQSSVTILTRVWAKTKDYWDLNWYLMEKVKQTFDENGINIPYNQLDVCIKSDDNKDKKNIQEVKAKKWKKKKQELLNKPDKDVELLTIEEPVVVDAVANTVDEIDTSNMLQTEVVEEANIEEQKDNKNSKKKFKWFKRNKDKK